MIKAKTQWPTVVRLSWPIHANTAGDSVNWNNPCEKQASDVSKAMKHSCQRSKHPTERGCLIKSVPSNWSKHCAAPRNDNEEDTRGSTCSQGQERHLQTLCCTVSVNSGMCFWALGAPAWNIPCSRLSP